MLRLEVLPVVVRGVEAHVARLALLVDALKLVVALGGHRRRVDAVLGAQVVVDVGARRERLAAQVTREVLAAAALATHQLVQLYHLEQKGRHTLVAGSALPHGAEGSPGVRSNSTTLSQRAYLSVWSSFTTWSKGNTLAHGLTLAPGAKGIP